MVKKATPAHLGKFLVSSSPRPNTDTTTNVINGMSTPVITNPSEAVAQWLPAE